MALEALRAAFGKVGKVFAQPFSIVITIIDLQEWKPHLRERFRKGMELVPITQANYAEWRKKLCDEAQRAMDRGVPEGLPYYVILKEGEVAATLGGRRDDTTLGYSYEVGEDELIVSLLEVEPRFRKGATAGVAVELVFEALQDLGLRTIYGTIASMNRSSLVFAQNLGWKQHERHAAVRVLRRFFVGWRRVEGPSDRFAPERDPARVQREQAPSFSAAARDGACAGAFAGGYAGLADLFLVLKGTGAWWVGAAEVLAMVAVYAGLGAAAGAIIGALLARLLGGVVGGRGGVVRAVLPLVLFFALGFLGTYHLRDVGLPLAEKRDPLPYMIVWGVCALACTGAAWAMDHILTDERARPGILAGVGLLLAGGMALGLRAQAGGTSVAPGIANRGPNVVLCVLDTTRRDAFSAYGLAPTATPGFDRLAEEGRLFTDAYSTAPWTPPSHASLFTGLHPSEHETRSFLVRLRPDIPVLSELFRDAGYDTLFVSGKNILRRDDGWTRGFETNVVADVEDRAHAAYKGIWQRFFGAPTKSPTLINMATVLIDRAEAADRPFLLFLNLDDPHTPYVGYEPWFSELLRDIDPTQVDVDKVLSVVRDGITLTRVASGEVVLNEEEIAYVGALYYSQVARMDAELERLADRLRATSRPTVLVVTADHGELLGEHGTWAHPPFLHDALVHVPFVLWAPELVEPGAVDEPASHIDVLPTLAGLAGVSLGGLDLPGRNLLSDPPPPAVFAEVWTKPQHLGHGKQSVLASKMAVAGAEKLIWEFPDSSRLYDLEADPNEDPGSAATQGANLERLLDLLGARFDLGASPTLSTDMDEDQRRKLESMGYL